MSLLRFERKNLLLSTFHQTEAANTRNNTYVMSFGEKVKIDLNKSSKTLLSTKVFPHASSIEVFFLLYTELLYTDKVYGSLIQSSLVRSSLTKISHHLLGLKMKE